MKRITKKISEKEKSKCWANKPNIIYKKNTYPILFPGKRLKRWHLPLRGAVPFLEIRAPYESTRFCLLVQRNIVSTDWAYPRYPFASSSSGKYPSRRMMGKKWVSHPGQLWQSQPVLGLLTLGNWRCFGSGMWRSNLGYRDLDIRI